MMNPNAPFMTLGQALGARLDVMNIAGLPWPYLRELEMFFGGFRIRGTPHVGGKGVLKGIVLSVQLPAPISAMPIIVRPERFLDRVGKQLRINEEVQTGNARIDSAVYFETDASAEAVRHLFADAPVAESLLELLPGVADAVHFGPTAIISTLNAPARPAADTIAVVIGTQWFANVAAIGRAAQTLAQLAGHIAESAGHAGPYGRGGFAAIPPPSPLPLGRTIAAMVIVGSAFVLPLPSAPPTLGWQAFVIGTAAASIVWVVLVAVVIVLLRGRSTSLRRVLIASACLLAVFPKGGYAGQVINGASSAGPSRVVPGTAVVRRGSKGAKWNEVRLDATGQTVSVDGALAAPIQFRSTPAPIHVTLRDGALGSTFVTGLEPAR